MTPDDKALVERVRRLCTKMDMMTCEDVQKVCDLAERLAAPAAEPPADLVEIVAQELGADDFMLGDVDDDEMAARILAALADRLLPDGCVAVPVDTLDQLYQTARDHAQSIIALRSMSGIVTPAERADMSDLVDNLRQGTAQQR